MFATGHWNYFSIRIGYLLAVVRAEADFYCIALPAEQPVPAGHIRYDGLYLSFGAARGHDGFDAATCSTGAGDVRAYLQFGQDASAVLGRREADGQWSALPCRWGGCDTARH